MESKMEKLRRSRIDENLSGGEEGRKEGTRVIDISLRRWIHGGSEKVHWAGQKILPWKEREGKDTAVERTKTANLTKGNMIIKPFWIDL
jgi:hypothetical protein